MSGNDTSSTSRRAVLKSIGAGAGVAATSGVVAGDDAVEVNVGWANDRGRAIAEDAADRIKREFNFDAMTAFVPQEAVAGLRNNPNVRYVEENGSMELHDDASAGEAIGTLSDTATNGQTTPYGIEITDSDTAIDEGSTGAGVSVAVMDSGIDPGHEDLDANVGEGNAYVDCSTDSFCGVWFGVPCRDECQTDWDDLNSHGTHVAGTAGAIDNDVGVVGVAPDVTLHSVKVCDACGSCDFDRMAAGIEWSADQGHHVQNFSLGGGESEVVADALEYAAERNVVLVSSAGNDGPDEDSVSYPASDEETIAVAASDEDDGIADFSSRGPEVEITAPGVDVLSTEPCEDVYDTKSGTSMAAPHVAGAAASLIEEIGVDEYEREEVREQLRDEADDIGFDENTQGDGRLNTWDAVREWDDDDDDDEGETVEVATDEATDVGETAATLNGELTTLEGADEADVGFEYGEAGGELDRFADAGTRSDAGPFEETVDDLEPGTEYEFRAVGETDDDDDAGAVAAFTTDEEGDAESDPVIESHDVSSRTSGPWQRATSTWEVSDEDGALDTVTSEMRTDDGTVVDAESTDVSGESASGEHDLRSREGDEADVELTVTDEAGNTDTNVEPL